MGSVYVRVGHFVQDFYVSGGGAVGTTYLGEFFVTY